MKIAIVLGTRPEIIKLASLIRECEERKVSYFLIHTGQHYSYAMDQLFFEELALPKAQYHLKLDLQHPSRHGEQVAKMMLGIEDILVKEKPDVVLVQGDTNSVLAGSLCASKLHIPLGHVEAGLRSYDKRMPEEYNRVVADHLATYLYVPTPFAKGTALKEGIAEKSILVTGNTIVDALYLYKPKALQSSFLQNNKVTKGNYFLVTAHRPENVDQRDTLQQLFSGLEQVSTTFHLPLLFPIHPRTKQKMEALQIKTPKGVTFIEPLGFFDFLNAELNAKLVLTDSGGVQEETCILQVPCVTLRDTTERPETLTAGSNILAGTDPKKILASVQTMLKRKPDWQHPFGEGNSSKIILDHLLSLF